MRAIVCDRLDGPASLRCVEVPSQPLAIGEVRIRVHAAGVNFPDLLMTEGKYQHKPPLPFVPGMECAGEVIETRAATFALGAQVIAGVRSGAFAEELVAPATALAHLPAGFSMEDGATFRIAFKTAYHALMRQGHLSAGETVLINGASGGVGMAAVQLAKRLGAKVIATGGSPVKLAAVANAGADHVIDLSKQDLRDEVMALTQERGVDVVYDPVGGDVFVQSLRAARYGARVLIVGFASGEIPAVPINRYLIKGLHVLGIRAGETGRQAGERSDPDLEAILKLTQIGDLRPHISHRLPFAEAAQALELLRARSVIGRAVLQM